MKLWLIFFLIFNSFKETDGQGFVNFELILLNAYFFSSFLLFTSFGGFYLYSGKELKHPDIPYLQIIITFLDGFDDFHASSCLDLLIFSDLITFLIAKIYTFFNSLSSPYTEIFFENSLETKEFGLKGFSPSKD